MRSRGTVTDKLFDVVQVLQTARKTGVLMVTRDGANNTQEQAAITLHNGQVVEVTVGHLRGNEAFGVLHQWRTCYFMFQPSVSTDVGLPALSALPGQPENGRKQPDRSLANPGVPYRIRRPDEVIPYFDRSGLSRAHRQLFLLIDGKRTIPELMRLAGQHSEGMSVLLADLERCGLIQQ